MTKTFFTYVQFSLFTAPIGKCIKKRNMEKGNSRDSEGSELPHGLTLRCWVTCSHFLLSGREQALITSRCPSSARAGTTPQLHGTLWWIPLWSCKTNGETTYNTDKCTSFYGSLFFAQSSTRTESAFSNSLLSFFKSLTLMMLTQKMKVEEIALFARDLFKICSSFVQTLYGQSCNRVLH